MGHAHGHSHSHDAPVDPRIARALWITSGVVLVVLIAGLALAWPRGDLPSSGRIGVAGEVFDGVVESVDDVPCEAVPEDSIIGGVCVEVTVRLLDGPDRGRTAVLPFPDSPTTPSFLVDERLVLAHQPEAEPQFRYVFVDRQRTPVLLWLAVAFAIAVVILGRLRGIAALVGLGLSVVVLLVFVLPAILVGRDPLLVAVLGTGAIAYAALYLAHGIRPMTTVALLGSLGSLALTALLASAFVGLAKISGFATEEAVIIQLFADRIDASGLVLAGIVVGALGALDDVTVTQASAVWELKAANPAMRARDLYRAGLRIGRDHVASTVNTLLLAYAGASLPLLVFFVLSEQALVDVANQEIVATEIVRTLVGSIGLVASVPLTTWLAAQVASATSTPTGEVEPAEPGPD